MAPAHQLRYFSTELCDFKQVASTLRFGKMETIMAPLSRAKGEHHSVWDLVTDCSQHSWEGGGLHFIVLFSREKETEVEEVV